MGFKFFRMRYYADFFNTNMQLRLILGLFKMKTTTLYTVNYHILAIGFFFVRVAVIPFAWISFYQNFSQVWKLACLESPIVMGILICIMVMSDTQNINWSSRLLKGLLATK